MPEAKEKAKEMFRKYMEEGVHVSPNLKWMVYSAGVRYGDYEEWKFAWEKYKTSQVPSEKSLWLRALADSPHPYILQQYELTAKLEKLISISIDRLFSGTWTEP